MEGGLSTLREPTTTGRQVIDSAVEAPPWAHLVGAAGSGMRSLAALLQQAGWRITGVDPRAKRVHASAHDAAWILTEPATPLDADVDLLIYTAAAAPENSQRRQAAVLGVPSRSYPQMLAEWMSGRRGLAVSGAHGKSTATAMLGECFWAAGADPSVVFGAQWQDGRPGGHFGRDETFLVEACEYRRHFLALAPQAALVLNLDWDHVDCYPSLPDVAQAFNQFARQLPVHGFLVVNADCPRASALADAARCRVIRFGKATTADYRYEIAESSGSCPLLEFFHHEQALGQVQLGVLGQHQAANAAGAAAMALEWGLAWPAVRCGLQQFAGLHRRLESLGSHGEIDVWDDYAHHPIAVAKVLGTLRHHYPGRRLVCVFEPHQETRLAAMLDEFALSLHNADLVGVTPVFRAREPHGEAPETAVGELVARLQRQAGRAPGTAVLLEGERHGSQAVCRLLRPGDVLVTMGAGDIRRLADDIVERLGGNRPAQ